MSRENVMQKIKKKTNIQNASKSALIFQTLQCSIFIYVKNMWFGYNEFFLANIHYQ